MEMAATALRFPCFLSFSNAHHGSVETYSSHSTSSFPVSGWPQNLHSTQFEHCKASWFSGKLRNMILIIFPNCFHSFLCINPEKILRCAKGMKRSNPPKGNISPPSLHLSCCCVAIAQLWDQDNGSSFTVAILSNKGEDGINAIKLLLLR